MRFTLLFAYVSIVQSIRRRAGLILAALTGVSVCAGILAFRYEGLVRADPMSTAEVVYSTLGLFAFASNRFGFPQTWGLIGVYFLAPFVSASALFEAALRVAEERSPLLLYGMRDHTVICGGGGLGTLLASIQEQLGEPAVVVDTEVSDATRPSGHVFLKGDVTRPAVLKAARVHRARQVFLTAGDDLVNLEVATLLRQVLRAEHRPDIYCHVADAELRDTLRNGEFGERVFYFNSYRLAAKALLARLVAVSWLPELELSPGCFLAVARDRGGFILRSTVGTPTTIAVVGLGRFGLAVVEQLGDLAPTGTRFLLVDRDPRRIQVAHSRLDARFPEVEAHEGNIDDPAWANRLQGTNAIVILCTDEDRKNLRIAMTLTSVKDARYRTVVRMFDQGFGERLAGVSGARQDLDLAGFRVLFDDAFAMLTHQRDVVLETETDGTLRPPAVRSPRIRGCVRTHPKGDAHRWYLANLQPGEHATVGPSARRVADLPWVGTPGIAPEGLWLLPDDALARLSARERSGGVVAAG